MTRHRRLTTRHGPRAAAEVDRHGIGAGGISPRQRPCKQVVDLADAWPEAEPGQCPVVTCRPAAADDPGRRRWRDIEQHESWLTELMQAGDFGVEAQGHTKVATTAYQKVGDTAGTTTRRRPTGGVGDRRQ